jgi:hypothetical protein
LEEFMADWQAEITPDGQPKHKLNFFARDEVQAKEFVDQHMEIVGGGGVVKIPREEWDEKLIQQLSEEKPHLLDESVKGILEYRAGGEIHQIRKVEADFEPDDDFDEDNPRPSRAARKTLGGY